MKLLNLLAFATIILSKNHHSVQGIDYMPCTENVDAAVMATAHRLLEQSTPAGYRLIEHRPLTQTGRNPHRWICRFERVDNTYRQDCDYLMEARTAFRRECPYGCEISQVGVSQETNVQFVNVEYLVCCGCRKHPRRRRHLGGFMREKATCTGIPWGKH